MWETIKGMSGFMGILGTTFILGFFAQQVWQEFQGKKATMLTFPKVLLACHLYTWWTINAMDSSNPFLFVAQLPGAILAYSALAIKVKRWKRRRQQSVQPLLRIVE